jgi:hypothetical protein
LLFFWAFFGSDKGTLLFFWAFFGSDFAECLTLVRQKALGKDSFVDTFFTECPLPNVALGKAFAEYKWGFAECLMHSAKNTYPVVRVKHFVFPGRAFSTLS